MITDMKDRIKALQMGSEIVQTELKETKAELLAERRHYDKFLVRDRERLVHAKEVVRNRMLVKQSFQNELDRQLGKVNTHNHQSKEKLD